MKEREKRTADLGKAIALALRKTRENQKLDPLHQDVYTREENIEKENPMKVEEEEESTLVEVEVPRSPPNESEKIVTKPADKTGNDSIDDDGPKSTHARPPLLRRKSCF